ncbi:transporter [Desulfosarcina alkanivorans]|jgi:outer membrane protein TolC|uniref:Transporter n=1 Tax=Desulfosarcina alkanivorans TaxID=571177 RepID=A0A5K7YVQ2_9BACT|nr:TolC family protein [Desulfosarcina alkanivorans]BBO72119.1 transporter [Desulfosarcina alkanivorans]
MQRQLIFLLMMTWAGSAAAEVLSIDQAVREALGNSPLIRQEAADRQAAHYAEKEARAAFFPSLTTAYSYRNLADAPFVNINGNQVTTNSRAQHHWEVSLTQPLFSGFAISARHRLAQLGLETRELEMQQTRLAVVLRVKQGCFSLLMAGKKLDVAHSNMSALAAHEADARMFHENGLVPLNDLLKAGVARAEAVQQVHRAVAGVTDARATLSLAMGRPYDSSIAITDRTTVAPLESDLDAQVKLALEKRPEVYALIQSIRSKEEALRLTRSDYYPRIDLTGRYQQDGDDPGAGNNDYSNQYNASIGIQAQWVLFEAGKTRAGSARIRAERHAAQQALRKMKDDVRLQVIRARLDLEVAAQNIDTARQALEQAREHWRITEALYRQQMTTSTEVLDARNYLNRAENTYYESRYSHGTALAQLQWAVGHMELTQGTGR